MSNIVYRSAGCLPAPWEDFFCKSGDKPNITMSTLVDARTEDPAAAAGAVMADDGWLDIVVDVPAIDEDSARLAIAEALKIDDPANIVIEQAGIAQSI